MTIKWRSCGEGSYVSLDGTFLVAQVATPGKKGTRQRWALYGRVNLASQPSERPFAPWMWDAYPLAVKDTKGNCQLFAAACGYEPPTREPPAEALPDRVEKAKGWCNCVECGVQFTRDKSHRYDDYCGKVCAEHVAERLMGIIKNGAKVNDLEGRPLRVGPARANEPDYVPRSGG